MPSRGSTASSVVPLTSSESLPIVVEPNQDTAQKILSEEIPEDPDEEVVKVQKKTMDLVVMFLEKVEAQKKAMDPAIITVNEPAESALVTKQQLDLERPCPGRPAPPCHPVAAHPIPPPASRPPRKWRRRSRTSPRRAPW